MKTAYNFTNSHWISDIPSNNLCVVYLHKAYFSQANEKATCFVYTNLTDTKFAYKKQATENSMWNILFTQKCVYFLKTKLKYTWKLGFILFNKYLIVSILCIFVCLHSEINYFIPWFVFVESHDWVKMVVFSEIMCLSWHFVAFSPIVITFSSFLYSPICSPSSFFLHDMIQVGSQWVSLIFFNHILIWIFIFVNVQFLFSYFQIKFNSVSGFWFL